MLFLFFKGFPNVYLLIKTIHYLNTLILKILKAYL